MDTDLFHGSLITKSVDLNSFFFSILDDSFNFSWLQCSTKNKDSGLITVLDENPHNLIDFSIDTLKETEAVKERMCF